MTQFIKNDTIFFQISNIKMTQFINLNNTKYIIIIYDYF